MCFLPSNISIKWRLHGNPKAVCYTEFTHTHIRNFNTQVILLLIEDGEPLIYAVEPWSLMFLRLWYPQLIESSFSRTIHSLLFHSILMFGSITVPDRDMDEDFWKIFLDNLDLLMELTNHWGWCLPPFWFVVLGGLYTIATLWPWRLTV